MKKILFSIFVLSTCGISAQTYSITPAKTVTFTAMLNNITINDIYQKNTGNTKIQLKWEKVSVNLPASWQFSMCDLGTCYSGIPNGPSTMDSVAVNGQGFLGLNVDPGNTPGSGMVKAFVYQNGFKSNGDTLTWYVKAGVVGIQEISLNDGIHVFPIPASDKLTVNLGYSQAISGSITDALGREILKLNLSSTNNEIDVKALPKGVYVLTIQTADKHLVKRIIKE